MTSKRILVAVMVAAGVVAPVATTGPAAGTPADVGWTGPSGTVTLVTGDEVTLGGPNGVEVAPAPGRARVGFSAGKDERGHVNVVPRDAANSLRAGRLDPRLFDVTELIATGYDDASRPELPLIVDYPGRTPRTASAQVVRELPSVGATVVHAQRSVDFWETARTQADRIWLDGPVTATLDRSVAQIHAPAAWEAGLTGAGTTVAVLDSGIDVTHPDLYDAVTLQENFTDSDTTDDRVGHGTHVASTITGDNDKYRGVAPDAKLLNGKVLDDFGNGPESSVIAGMEWAAANGADVINMSLGTTGPNDGTDPLSLALDRITAETGALFVVAAGNTGPDSSSIGSPGAADAALTVGAVDRDDQLAEFSSRGPRRQNEAIKPDITAPGVGIVAAKAKNGHLGTPVEPGYVAMDGTSMAAPHVAGAAAILAGQHPEWTASQLKAHLMGSAVPNESSVFEQGAGRVDVAAAVASTVTASPASISNGVVEWPHDDDVPVAKSLTYTNSGTESVTLDLSIDATAPQGMFTVEPARVTVPAGGQASATVTTDTRVEAQDGVHSGALVATAGDMSVRTPVAVNREVESYDVTLSFLDHDGQPTTANGFRFVDVVNPRAVEPGEVASTYTVRVPKGTYYFEAYVQTFGGESIRTTDIIEPSLPVTGDAELVLDARDGVKPTFKVDQPTAQAGRVKVDYARRTDWGATGLTVITTGFDGNLVRPSRTSAPGDFTFGAEAELAEPDGSGAWPGFANSPYLYHVRWFDSGGAVPAELDRAFADRDLAKVRATHAVSTPGLIGVRNDMVATALPFTLTEYYTPDVPWIGNFSEVRPDGSTASYTFQSVGRSYPTGRVTDVRWNVGVHGPAFPNGQGDFADRRGDDLFLGVPLATDQDSGRAGWPHGATGESVLLRDGQEIASGDGPGFLEGVVLPADEATYTYRTSAERPDSQLSTRISAEWTFRSGHADEPVDLPLLAVRYAPNLDDQNAAPAGRTFRFPVSVQHNGGGQVNTPTVEVSYDDGTTWRPVRLDRKGSTWHATVDHPSGAEFVSLRSSVSDKHGNKSGQTIIRAYALKS